MPSITNAPPTTHHPNQKGVYCSLLTGQEKRIVPFAEHISATVEMVNLANVRLFGLFYVLLEVSVVLCCLVLGDIC